MNVSDDNLLFNAEDPRLGFLWSGMNVAVHPACPFKKAPKVDALGPEKFPEFEEADLRHFDARIGLHAPEKIGAAPGRETVSSRRVPEEAEHVAHSFSVYRRQATGRVSGSRFQGKAAQVPSTRSNCW